MSRLARLALTLCTVFTFLAGLPAQSHAGVIPWLYDAVFGPVGSMQTNAYYRRAARYGAYPASVGYAPTTVAYAPMSYASYGAGGSGCACNQTSAYYPGYSAYPAYSAGAFYSDAYAYNGPSGCSSCGGSGCSSCNGGCSSCASGNCSAGVSSTPVTSGYGPGTSPSPTPDPALNTNNRDMNSRINELEHQLKVLDHRQREDEKFLDRQYEGKYSPSPYSSGNYGGSSNTYRGHTETVPPRQRRDSFDSSDQMYTPRPAPSREPLEQDVRKPELTIPAPLDKSSEQPQPSLNLNEAEPQALNLDHRMTSRAVAPRERMEISTKNSKLQSVAQAKNSTVKTSEHQSSAALAHH